MIPRGTLIIGLDPGKTGAIAFIDADKFNLVTVINLKGSTYGIASKINRIIKPYKHVVVWFEKVRALNGVGSNTTFGFGYQYGRAHAIFDMFKLTPPSYVLPQTWQAYFNISVPKVKGRSKYQHTKVIKQTVAIEALSYFANASEYIYNKRQTLQDGASDAILIAIYGYKQNAATSCKTHSK